MLNEHFLHRANTLYTFFQPDDWNHWAQLTTLLRRVENAQSALSSDQTRIIDHLFHIGSRQFEWQQGFLNYSEVFRGIFIYGQGKCADRFFEKFGISIDSFFTYGFALMSMFLSHPRCRADIDLSTIGVSSREAAVAHDILVSDVPKIARLCQAERDREGEIAYKPSILRLYPCIKGGIRNRYIYCPLPELIIKRVSTGIFYDVIDGGADIREDYGRRFEQYVKLLIQKYQPDFFLSTEQRYMTRKGELMSPDLFLSLRRESFDVIIECKASRMSFRTRFSHIDDTGNRGYEEMSKAVFQIWRHAFHVRTGKGLPKVTKDAIGLVLTLDSWFQAGIKRQEMVLSEAKKLFSEKCPDGKECDQIPIGFTNMTELEHVLRSGTPASILAAIRELSSEERRGWSFDIIHNQLYPGELRYTAFPFEDELCELLPFWGTVRDSAREKRKVD